MRGSIYAGVWSIDRCRGIYYRCAAQGKGLSTGEVIDQLDELQRRKVSHVGGGRGEWAAKGLGLPRPPRLKVALYRGQRSAAKLAQDGIRPGFESLPDQVFGRLSDVGITETGSGGALGHKMIINDNGSAVKSSVPIPLGAPSKPLATFSGLPLTRGWLGRDVPRLLVAKRSIVKMELLW
jgi:hypothetical protein